MTSSARYRPKPLLSSSRGQTPATAPLILLIHPAGADSTTRGRFHDLLGKPPPLAAVVARLGCNRGIAELNGLTLAAEVAG